MKLSSRRSKTFLIFTVFITILLGVCAVIVFGTDIFRYYGQIYDLTVFLVCTAFGFSSAVLIYMTVKQPPCSVGGVSLVRLQRPLNLLEGEVVYVTNADSLVSIAKNKKGEIFAYEFSPTMTFFYTLSDNKKFVYVKNLKNPVAVKKRLTAI